jgi:hypothetical protein
MDDQKQPLPAIHAVETIEDSRIDQASSVIKIYDSYTPEFAAETERKLVRRIDLRLMPLVVGIYIFNYLDRNSITQARLYGLQKDLGVHGAVYQTAISIFSAGYIIMQLPSVLLMTKVRPSRFLVSLLILAFCSQGLNR